MKCPICEAEIKNTSSSELRCIRCGFDDIRTEFINDEERIFWQTYVVKPCKYAYRLNHTLQNEVAMLRREIKKLSSGNTTAQGTNTSSAPAQPKTVALEGWNYSDPLSHPNSAKCKHGTYMTNVELTDIKTQIDSSRKAIISFVARRITDSPEKKRYSHIADDKTVGFCWRVKDDKGIIVLTGKWYNTNLLIGDAIADKVELKNVPNGYSIDFVDYT